MPLEGYIVIRVITRPSTARCTLPMYIGFLLSEPNGVSCSRLASVLSIASFIEVFAQEKSHLNPKFQAVVNA